MSFKNTERLHGFSNIQLGLERGPTVHLSESNERWKRAFSDEAYFIFDHLRDESLRLFHIGSTSIPGIVAKPIIDILGSVGSLSDLDKKKEIFESIGYEYKGEYGIQGRRYCVLYSPDKTTAFVHLHFFEHENAEVSKHLLFRDYLRKNGAAAKEYEALKIDLARIQKIERSKYSDAKNEVIARLQRSAELHEEKDQKILAIIGASEGHQNTKKYLTEKFTGRNFEIVDLFDGGLKPYSYQGIPDDLFFSTIEKLIQSDLTVLATPVYWYAMSGLMKDFIDRFSNLMSGKYKYLGEALYGKQIKVLSTGYDSALPLGFEVPFAGTAIYFGMDYMGAEYSSTQGAKL